MGKIKTKQQAKNNWLEKATSDLSPYKIIFIVCLVLYVQILTFGLVHFDDHGFVLLSSDLLKLSNIPAFFHHSVFWVFGETKQDFDVYYRPLQNVVYAICNAISPKQPWSYHFAGFLLHLAVSLLLFNFFKEFKFHSAVCLVFALIYCVHPVLVQGVAWIAGVGDQMATLFVLISFISFSKMIQSQKFINRNLFIHLLSLLAALFSKEVSIAVIPMCLFYFLFIIKNKISGNTRFFTPLGWLVVLIVYFIFRSHALVPSQTNLIDSVLASFKANSFLVFEYIEKTFLPYRLSPMSSRIDAQYILGAGLLVSIILIFIFKKRISPIAVFGICWFFIFLLPTFIQVNPQKPFYAFEHRLYLPLIGMLLVIIELIQANKLNFHSKKIQYGFAIVLLIFFATTFSYSLTFYNAYGFFDKVISRSPKSVIAYNAYAAMLLEDKKYADAIEAYKKSFLYDPSDKETSGKIADIYLKNLNNPLESIVWFKKTFAVAPTSIEAAVSIADVYFNTLHDTINAELWYSNALKIDPKNTFALSSLGVIYIGKRKVADGRKLLFQSIKQNSKNLLALKWLAISCFNEGNISDAVNYLNKAYENYPNDIDLQRNLMICYYKLNDFQLTQKFTSIYRAGKNEIPAEIENYLKK